MDKDYINRLHHLLQSVNEQLTNLDQSTEEYNRKEREEGLLNLQKTLETRLTKSAVSVDQIGINKRKFRRTRTINSVQSQKPLKPTKKLPTDLECVTINRIKVPVYHDEIMRIRYEKSPLRDFDDRFDQDQAYSRELLDFENKINLLFTLENQNSSEISPSIYEVENYHDSYVVVPYTDKKTEEFENEKVADNSIELSAKKKDEGASSSMPTKTKTKKKPAKSASEKPKKKIIKKIIKKPKTAKKPTSSKATTLPSDEIAISDAENNNSFVDLDLPEVEDTGVKALKQIQKRQKQLTSKYSKEILNGAVVTTTHYHPNLDKHVIELSDVTKSYLTGDVETQVLKGIDIKLNKSDFIVILGPSGSGKTTFLNTISGLDKATKGDVFVLGYNLSLLKDSHLTKFRRKHVGFIFQQYNLLTNLTAKENAEVGENLSTKKHPEMGIEDIFETIGMKDQMNKYPHQMSGGQQQRVSIARALAKNPDILFADEPTGALDEEMGRKVLQILVDVNKLYKTTVIVVTHNPNIAKIGNTIIHIKNGLIDDLEHNAHPADPEDIDWS